MDFGVLPSHSPQLASIQYPSSFLTPSGSSALPLFLDPGQPTLKTK